MIKLLYLPAPRSFLSKKTLGEEGEGCLQIKMARTTRQGDPNLIPSDHDKLPILETSHPGRKGTLGLAHGNVGGASYGKTIHTRQHDWCKPCNIFCTA